MTAPLTFGSWLKRRRQGLGLTQKELARQVGYAPVTLRKVEADELRPSGQMAKRLAEALELAPDEQAQFVRFARDEAHWDDLALPDRVSSPPLFSTHPQKHADSTLDALQSQVDQAAVGRAKPKHNLPALTTMLLGREEELADLGQLLANPATRLVTILSAGGMGKTSLAVAAAWQQIDHFDDGVCWVPLAPLAEAKDLVLAIATALGLPLQGERAPERQVGDFLCARHMLLVLDNFEHLLDSVSIIGDLLSAAPQLWILVTSRRRLKLSSETVIFLDGLRSPPEHGGDAHGYPALQMFLLHARRIRGRYEPDDQEVASIAAVCRLVHGMPLGILLAAAWTRVLSPAEIAAEIAKDQGFLQTDMPDVPARQRSLRAVFLHTWNRLSAEERGVFIHLSVFRGGATLDAARHVAGATIGVLAALIDHALLRRLPDSRYEIHELLRQFAQERLEQDQDAAFAARDAHSAYFSRFLAQRETAITYSGQRRAIQEVGADLDNIRAAWIWAAERRLSTLLRDAASTLAQYCDWQGRYHEGVQLCEQAIDKLRPAESVPDNTTCEQCEQVSALAVLFSAAGWLYIRLGKYAQSRHALTRSFTLYAAPGVTRPPGHMGQPLLGLALLADVVGDYGDAVALANQAQAAALASGDRYNQQLASYVLASTSYAQGEYAAARLAAEEAYTIAAEIDARSMMAYIAIIQGNVARACGDLRAAQQHYTHSHALQSELGNPEGMAVAQLWLAGLAAMQRNYQEAEPLFHDCYQLYREINDPGGQVRALIGLGDLAQAQGKEAQAGSYFCTALELAAAIRSLPLLLQQFTPIGELLASAGEPALAASAWKLVTQHAAGDHEMQQRAQDNIRRTARFAKLQPAAQADSETDDDPFNVAALLRDKLALVSQAQGWSTTAARSQPLKAAPALVEPLSERELEILHLMATGMTNQQIADRLIVTVGTVKVHIHHIFGKLGASHRAQAIVRARDLNLLP